MALQQPQQPAATEPTVQAGPAESAALGAPAAPADPIDLDQDPFGVSLEEGEQTAGIGGKILKWLLGKGGKKAAGEAAEEGIDAGARAAGEASAEQPGTALARAGAEAEPAEGTLAARVPPEVQLGSTRPLANLDYYNDPGTQEVLKRVQAAGTPAPAQSWATTEAQAVAADVEKLTGRKPSLNWTPGDVLKMRQLLDSQGKAVKELADRLNTKLNAGHELSTEEVAEFELRTTQLVGTQNAVAGLSTEAGRLLQSLQIRVDTPESVWRDLADVVKRGGGEENIRERVRNVATASSPGQVQRAVSEGWGQFAWRQVLQLRYNLMLSSVRTHAANVAGSMLSSAYETAVIDPLTYINNRLLVGATKGLQWAGLPVNVEGQLAGLPAAARQTIGANIRGTIDGLRLAGQIARGVADPAQYGGKFATEIGTRYKPGEGWGQSYGGVRAAAGKLASTPTRLLEAEDAFFRARAYQVRLEQLALDKASRAAGGDIDLRRTLTEEWINEPTDEMRLAAKEYAEKLTYTNDPSIYGKLFGSLTKGVEKVAEYGPFKLLVPFIRTPSNLLGYSMEQTGLIHAVAPKRALEQLTSEDPRVRAEMLARTEAAFGAMVLLHHYWEQDLFTGMGSSNYNTVQVMESQGWQQNALMTEDGYVTLNRLDPLGSTLGMVASAFELHHELGDEHATVALVGALLSTADMMQDRSYLSGLSDLVVMLDQGKGGVKAAANLVASTGVSMVNPNVLRDARNVMDPHRRDLTVDYDQGAIKGAIDRGQKLLLNALPSYSKTLPPKVDWKGDYILSNAHPLIRGFVPIEYTEKNFDPPSAAILANNVAPRRPDHRITVPGTSGQLQVNLLAIDPSGLLYADYQQSVGKLRHRQVAKLIGSRGYRKAVEAGQAGYAESAAGKAIQKVLAESKGAANAYFLDRLAKPGSKFCVGDECFVVTPEVAEQFDLRGAADAYLRYNQKPTETGLQVREKDQPSAPKWMTPEF